MGRVLELISKSDEHPNKRFFKFPRKYKKFPLCEFYMFEEEYANFLVRCQMLDASQMFEVKKEPARSCGQDGRHEEEARAYELDDMFWCCCTSVVRFQFGNSPCVGADENV